METEMEKLEKFRELGISDRTLFALKKKGFEEPSPVQAMTIPLLLKGEKDVIGQAQTGTGKTAAFGIPMVELLDGGAGHIQAIVLAPTRELAIQVSEEINSLKGDKALEVIPVYGGQSYDIQCRRLSRGVDIVVGTPGRLIDLLDRGVMDLSKVSFAVLDEADEMLNMGFIDDIRNILGRTPKDKRMLMFSATMPKAVLSIASSFMRGYDIVKVENRQLTSDLTEQIYFEVRRESKFEALCRIIDMEPDFFGLVFCRTRNDVDEVTERLTGRGYGAEALHGDISQAQRIKVLDRVKRKQTTILVATDVAARGIDINNLSHVINDSSPQDSEAYVHRIGRTGRAGNQGTAITFVTPAEYRTLTMIKRSANISIRKERLPDADDVIKLRKNRIKDEISVMLQEPASPEYTKFAEDLLGEHNAESLLPILLRYTFGKELMPENYPDLEGRGPRRQYEQGDSDIDSQGKARLFVALGRKDNATPRQIADMIRERANIMNRHIQDIQCFDTFTFVTVPFAAAEKVVEAFREEGRRPLVELAADKKDKEGRPESDPGFKGGRKTAPEKKYKKKSDPDKGKRRKKSPGAPPREQ